jgi:hypothetical protein
MQVCAESLTALRANRNWSFVGGPCPLIPHTEEIRSNIQLSFGTIGDMTWSGNAYLLMIFRFTPEAEWPWQPVPAGGSVSRSAASKESNMLDLSYTFYPAAYNLLLTPNEEWSVERDPHRFWLQQVPTELDTLHKLGLAAVDSLHHLLEAQELQQHNQLTEQQPYAIYQANPHVHYLDMCSHVRYSILLTLFE